MTMLTNKFLNSPLWNVSLFSLFWAFEVFFSKLAFISWANPIAFVFQSWFVSLIIMMIFILPNKIHELKNLKFKIIKWILIANAIQFSIWIWLNHIWLAFTSAINAWFLIKSPLITTPLLAWLILNEKINYSKIITIILTLFWIFLITTKWKLINPQIWDIFIILAWISTYYLKIDEH